MTTIVDFCIQHNIKWFPISLKLETNADGKIEKILQPVNHKCYAHDAVDKSGKPYKHYKPSQSDFADCSDEVLAERQRLFRHTCEHIAMDTSMFFHIDIDVPEYSPEFDTIAQTTPYFCSTTKSYGKHILVKNEQFSPAAKRLQLTNIVDGHHVEGVELLCGQWSYAPRDGNMFNYHGNVNTTLDVEAMLVKVDKKKKTKAEKAPSEERTQSQQENNQVDNLKKLVLMKDCFCPTRLNNYDEYIKFSIAVKANFGESGKEIWDEICKKCKKYNQQKNYEQWSEISLKKEKKKVTMGSLCWWAREDNPTLYQELFGQRTDWTLSEAVYAAKFTEVCFDKNIIFTGKDLHPDGYMFNGVYWEELSLHNAELQKGKFTDLYKWFLAQIY